ncbi:hypothetical protein ACIG3E_11270 [Streptomyces sp. NPDC053474]
MILCPGSEVHMPYAAANAWQDELPQHAEESAAVVGQEAADEVQEALF